MKTVKFKCPQCGQSLKTDSGDAGSSFPCPTCQCSIIAPLAPGFWRARNIVLMAVGVVLCFAVAAIIVFRAWYNAIQRQYADLSAPRAVESNGPRKIFGAFGFKLGDPLPSRGTPVVSKNGQTFYFLEISGFAPFTTVSLYALDDGRIYSIIGDAANGDVDTILTALTNNYGPAQQAFDSHDGVRHASLSDGYADISVEAVSSSVFVNYTDRSLDRKHDQDQAAQKSADAQKLAKGL